MYRQPIFSIIGSAFLSQIPDLTLVTLGNNMLLLGWPLIIKQAGLS